MALENKGEKSGFRLPKNALSKINLGQSFAENDRVLANRDVFVRTPALEAAANPDRSKCFYIGRRGTGKTAIATYLQQQSKNVTQVHPELFLLLEDTIDLASLEDPRKRPFLSLVSSCCRAILDEAVATWIKLGKVSLMHFPEELNHEKNFITDHDFDERLVEFVERLMEFHANNNEKRWLREKKKVKSLNTIVNSLCESSQWHVPILIDRIDDAWDGSNKAVIMLSALMHACVEMWSASKCIRPMLFLRENIFERVRDVDREFSK